MKKFLGILFLNTVILFILTGCVGDLSKLIPPLPNSTGVADTTLVLPSSSFEEICGDYNNN